MEEWPLVVVVIITYRREELARQTIHSVKQYLDYPNLGWHIADDGSGFDYVSKLCREIGPDFEVSVSDSTRGGVGKNMNMGIAEALKRADMWLHLEDDWVLRQPFDLRPCAQILAEDTSVGMVRLGRLTAGIEATTISGANKMWWRMRRGSDTYVFSGNAALRHRRFHEAYGPYNEKLTPGRTELWYCDRFTRMEGPSIVWPAWINTDEAFFHIGDSQSFKYYMEREGMTGEQAAERFEGSGQ